MPDRYSVAFNPRYYECDPDGKLHTASYVRYILQAAIEAGAPADLASLGLDAAGWLEHVGDIGLQLVQPVVYGDKLDVQTWLGQSGPPVWRREFTLKRGAATLAAAFVDTFDEDDSQAGAEDGPELAPNDSPTWDSPVSDPPEPPRRAFRALWRAGWQFLDISGQPDPAYLTQIVSDMEGRAAESLGWTVQRDEELGIAWQATEYRLELFDSMSFGDVLNIISYIGEMGDDSMVRHTLIRREDDGIVNEVARARTRWVCLSSATGQRCAIPDDWFEDLADQMSEE